MFPTPTERPFDFAQGDSVKTESFALGVGGVLLAEFAVFAQGKLFLHFLLVALGVVIDATARGALELRHRILDLSHNSLDFNCLQSLSTLRENTLFVNTEPLIGIEPMTSSFTSTSSSCYNIIKRVRLYLQHTAKSGLAALVSRSGAHTPRS